MRLSNRLNLPEPLVRAVANDPYDKGYCDYSVTELISPVRIAALKRQHASELVEDAADRIYSLLGQISHVIIERAAMKELVEHRLYAQWLGKTIGGQLDLLDGGILMDFKVTSVWAFAHGVKPEWQKQLNCLAALARENNLQVNSAQIVAIYRDWSVSEARRSGDYPATQVQVFHIPLWEANQQTTFICERVALHEAAKERLPECTALERWAKPDKWALLKKGQKRAQVLCDTQGQAEEYLKLYSEKTWRIEQRPGVNTRCESYCPVSGHCEQFKKLKNEIQKPG